MTQSIARGRPETQGHAPQTSLPRLRSLRRYFGIILGGNLVWEILHLPLYTIWSTGTFKDRAFAVGHCTR